LALNLLHTACGKAKHSTSGDCRQEPILAQEGARSGIDLSQGPVSQTEYHNIASQRRRIERSVYNAPQSSSDIETARLLVQICLRSKGKIAEAAGAACKHSPCGDVHLLATKMLQHGFVSNTSGRAEARVKNLPPGRVRRSGSITHEDKRAQGKTGPPVQKQ